MNISNIDSEYQLITDSQEVNQIDAHMGLNDTEEHSFFVKTENGDYTSVLMFAGSVPYLDKKVVKIL